MSCSTCLALLICAYGYPDYSLPLINMSPKSTSSSSKPAPKSEAKSTAAALKKDQQTMVTTLKLPSATPEQRQALDLYQKLPRFDERKRELLDKYKKDKSCTWVIGYTETHGKTHEETSGKVHGYGSVL